MAGGRKLPLNLVVVLSLVSAVATAAQPKVPASGGLTPVIGVAPASLDFGCIDVGECSERRFEVSNANLDPESQLTVVAVEFVDLRDFDSAAEWGWYGAELPLTLSGGQSVSLTAVFCPVAIGNRSLLLRITALEATNTPFDVLLAAIGNAPPLLCDAGKAQVGIVGQELTFDGSASEDPGGQVVDYQWDFGDGAQASGAIVRHAYSVAGRFLVTLTLTDDCGSSASCTTTASISEGNLPPDCDPGGPYLGVVEFPLVFDGTASSDPDGTIVAFDWQFGDGAGATGAIVEHVYELSGTYTATLCVTDDGGATSCCETAVVVDAPTPVLSSELSVIAVGANVRVAWVGLEAFSPGAFYRLERSIDGAFDLLCESPARAGQLYYCEDGAGTLDRRTYRLSLFDGADMVLVATTSIGPAPSAMPILQRSADGFLVHLRKSGPIAIRVYNVSGRYVDRVFEGPLTAGSHTIPWESGSTSMTAGFYFARLMTRNGHAVEKFFVP